MGTDKRNRQKENRRARQTVVEKQVKRQKMRRNIMRIGFVLVIVFAAVAAIYSTGGNDTQTDGATEVSETTVVTDSPVSSVAPAPTGPFAYGEGECAPSDDSATQTREFATAPKLCIDPAKTYTALISTNKGDLTVVLDPAKAPGTVNNFVNLARFKYFDGTICHRAIPTFVVQCGDPTATGGGGPGYSIADELPNTGEYKLGSLAMANSGPNTNGSQFFIITGEQGVGLPPSYSLFGQVTEGVNSTLVSLDKAANPDPAKNGVPPTEELRIIKVTINES